MKVKHKALNTTHDAELVSYKPVTIDTEWGPALIMPGNYILTDKDGKKIGITPQDLHIHYDTLGDEQL